MERKRKIKNGHIVVKKPKPIQKIQVNPVLADCPPIKDEHSMSRLGRDYLKAGFYTEVLIVEKGVRFIAINNGIGRATRNTPPDKSSGHREQQIDISYDLVGILPASLFYDLSNRETA